MKTPEGPMDRVEASGLPQSASAGEIDVGLRALVEETPLLICSFLPGGEITLVNRAYCDYFDKTREELVGSSFLTLIPEESREAVMANISALTVETPVQSHEHQVTAPDGRIRWQRWHNRASLRRGRPGPRLPLLR